MVESKPITKKEQKEREIKKENLDKLFSALPTWDPYLAVKPQVYSVSLSLCICSVYTEYTYRSLALDGAKNTDHVVMVAGIVVTSVLLYSSLSLRPGSVPGHTYICTP